MNSILIIGGSGMLSPVAEHFLQQDYKVAVLSRQPFRADAHLNRDAEHIAADYFQTDSFIQCLEAYLQRSSPQLVICWMRSSAMTSLIALINSLSIYAPACTFHHLKGSAWWSGEVKLPEEIRAIAFYREILLGYKITESGVRWLSDAEICAGVIEAIAWNKSSFSIGTTPYNESDQE